MFDGWSDKYKGKPFMGVSASFIKNWKYHVITLVCHILPQHTAKDTADHDSDEKVLSGSQETDDV